MYVSTVNYCSVYPASTESTVCLENTYQVLGMHLSRSANARCLFRDVWLAFSSQNNKRCSKWVYSRLKQWKTALFLEYLL